MMEPTFNIFSFEKGSMLRSWLEGMVFYDKKTSFIFTSSYFWIFFAIVLGVYTLIYQKQLMRSVWLFAVSIYLYYQISGFFFFILLFSTCSDYFIGKKIHASKRKSRRLALLVLSIFINLLVLSYFKYGHLFIMSVNDIFGTNWEVYNPLHAWVNDLFSSGLDVGKFVLPVGISFYTFQTISYSVDVYRGHVKPVNNILDFGFYVSFFPQLVAGPIVRASEFIPQIYEPYSLSRSEFGLATFWILKGYVKKMILADFIATGLLDQVFDRPELYTGFQNMMSMYGYSLQVYGDFAGYTDMAIGIALLLGFRLPRNFNSPYKAVSTGDFWKRWHISLSTWLKDYLYIPLGGSKDASFLTYAFFPLITLAFCIILGWQYALEITGGMVLFAAGYTYAIWYFPVFKRTISTNINLMTTMLLGGIWHGSTWLFMIWGGLNGLGIILYKMGRDIAAWTRRDGWDYRITQLVLGTAFAGLMLSLLYAGGMNLTALMFLGGWIGLSLVGLIVYLLLRGPATESPAFQLISRAWMIFLTFNFITYTRIWFRHKTLAGTEKMMAQITDSFGFDTILPALGAHWPIYTTILLGMIIHWLPSDWKKSYREAFIALPIWAMMLIAVAVVYLVFQTKTPGATPFIYFDF